MFLFICKVYQDKDKLMDSRTSSILINLDLDLNSGQIANQYVESKAEIEESQKGDPQKVYRTLRSTLKECYFVGSLKYGNNFIM